MYNRDATEILALPENDHETGMNNVKTNSDALAYALNGAWSSWHANSTSHFYALEDAEKKKSAQKANWAKKTRKNGTHPQGTDLAHEGEEGGAVWARAT